MVSFFEVVGRVSVLIFITVFDKTIFYNEFPMILIICKMRVFFRRFSYPCNTTFFTSSLLTFIATDLLFLLYPSQPLHLVTIRLLQLHSHTYVFYVPRYPHILKPSNTCFPSTSSIYRVQFKSSTSMMGLYLFHFCHCAFPFVCFLYTTDSINASS